MTAIIKVLTLLMLLSTVGFAGVDNNPLNAGTTQGHNVQGHNFEAALYNPALLGVDRAPHYGFMVPGTMVGVGAWSDKLALSPLDRHWYDSLGSGSEQSKLISKILRKSFAIDGLSPDEVSKKLTEGFKGGVMSYAGYRQSLVNLGWNRIAFDIATHFDEEVKIPEGPLMMIFSKTDGLLPGNTLDFSTFKQDAVWATDFSFHFGLPVIVPALHDFFKLRYGAGGIGVKYVMGHSILKATTERGRVYFDDVGNEVDVDGSVKIQTAGMGYSGQWDSKKLFSNGLPVSGHGIGFDVGGILYDDHGTLTVNFHDLGVLFWMNNVQDVTYGIKKNNLDAYDIIRGIEEAEDGQDPNLKIFNRNANEFISSPDDTLKEGNGFVSWLPAAFNIGYAYSWDLSHMAKQEMRYLANYINASANFEQALARGPGRRFIPRLSLGGEAGALKGYLPVRIGYVVGGSELFASAVGLGVNLPHCSINASYKAMGNPFFIPKRGMELAFGVHVSWGSGIKDKDGDGILDRDDSCPTVPEDLDGFEDTDGCPDFDNDNDGIPDSVDVCPMEPEDRDNFEDEDGCPDFDNDGDGVPDSLDKCPNVPEDIDLFEDTDGCPDYDNDKDGIPDTLDNCMMEPEVYNGYKDEDGCPDTLIRPTEKEEKALNTKLRAINFKTGSAELLPVSFAAIDYVVNFLNQYSYLRYEIQGHTDNRGSDEYNLLLSAARAGSVRGYLLSKGISQEKIIAIGYGEAVPIADNNTSTGRALNRRVAFKIIETDEQYQMLQIREAEFNEKVREAKIKGVQ